MKLGLLGSTKTHRGTLWAPNWAFTVREARAGEFEFSEKRRGTRRPIIFHLRALCGSHCYQFRATLKVFKVLGDELKVEGARRKHHHHLERPRSCSQEDSKLLHLCSSFISTCLNSIEVVLTSFRDFSTCTHTCKVNQAHATPSPP
ncbi:hypothetical protein E3N88_28309 [Mikania micrantha]|uniref:Uncharacterized protein n=1 Tax=Mikania micrantha TaxID=192012 RepID=A0A5N6MZ88_9ASTR|nr:hypothetical protein E3N88_28309 [Mikania micrantha]